MSNEIWYYLKYYFRKVGLNVFLGKMIFFFYLFMSKYVSFIFLVIIRVNSRVGICESYLFIVVIVDDYYNSKMVNNRGGY